jgi:hypothetical protein
VRKASNRWLWVAALGLLVGCQPDSIWVTQRPAFDYQKIRRIGVMAFAYLPTETDAEAAGAAVADKVTRFLIEHRDYQVAAPEEIAQALEAKKYAPPKTLDAPAMKRICEIAGLDALVLGKVTQCEFRRTERTKVVPEYVDTGWAVYQEGALSYRAVANDAKISAEIQVFDASSGLVVWSDSASYRSWSEGSPPAWDREQVLQDASDQVAARLFLGLVVHKNGVAIPKRSLFTSAGFVGQEPVNQTRQFTTKDETVFVVLCLNDDFRSVAVNIAVFKKGNDAPLGQVERVWGRNAKNIGVPFQVKDLVAKGGAGDYVAKYFIDGLEIRSAEFTIR